MAPIVSLAAVPLITWYVLDGMRTETLARLAQLAANGQGCPAPNTVVAATCNLPAQIDVLQALALGLVLWVGGAAAR